MVTSCFFCQNLLSDFVEGILPAARHDELKKHLDTCEECGAVHEDLVSTLKVLGNVSTRTFGPEVSLRISEASQAGRRSYAMRFAASRWMLAGAVPVLVFGALVLSFPNLFPWFSTWRTSPDDSQMVRYFPILQGATDILEEQASWLSLRDSNMASVWEEGGISPDDFEKTFQMRPRGTASEN